NAKGSHQKRKCPGIVRSSRRLASKPFQGILWVNLSCRWYKDIKTTLKYAHLAPDAFEKGLAALDNMD
ncbi:MAG: hypothetical protein OIF54_15885, partial [Cohaesibacter sp.]|nr:hypothetical protein [Cohaesibacter sp.]